ncbi:MAG: hypothetical protein M3198_00010 [Actinomycetota bacterium]|nr:hypothetical protein [Actinomycetota bacterium]
MRTSAFFLSLALALALGACSKEEEGSTPSEITGVVTQVESSGLTEVESFTVRDDDTTYDIRIDPETDLGFPPAHLNEHRVSGQPVTVEVEDRGGDLYAVSIEDAT